MTTDRQKKAIWFCNKTISTKFEGDVDNFDEVSSYLSQHLEEAKKQAEQNYSLRCYSRGVNVNVYDRLSEYNRYTYEDDWDDINVENPHWIVE